MSENDTPVPDEDSRLSWLRTWAATTIYGEAAAEVLGILGSGDAEEQDEPEEEKPLTEADLLFTQEDLRIEAAYQHANLVADPDFTGIGELLEGNMITSRPALVWGNLSDTQFRIAQVRVADLLGGAADTGRWAVDLGVDDLEPCKHTITLTGTDKTARMRLHLAFDPGMPEDVRQALVVGLGAAAVELLGIS
jgi:hypothetical protein